jgi:hypothetical protein
MPLKYDCLCSVLEEEGGFEILISKKSYQVSECILVLALATGQSCLQLKDRTALRPAFNDWHCIADLNSLLQNDGACLCHCVVKL